MGSFALLLKFVESAVEVEVKVEVEVDFDVVRSELDNRAATADVRSI
jgi:hypothetical protein